MASETQIQAAQAELDRRGRVEAAKAELARRQSMEQTAPVESASQQPESEESLMSWLAGQVEPTATTLSGMAGSAVGGIAGLGQIPLYASGISDTPPEQIVKKAQQAMTYQPRTETGNKLVDAMSRNYNKYIEEPIVSHARTGDATLERTGSPLLATINQLGPEIVGSVLAFQGNRGSANKFKPSTKIIPEKVNPKTGELISAMTKESTIKKQILGGGANEKTAGYRLTESGAMVKDSLQKKAINKGWSAKAASWAANQTKSTRTKLGNMLDSAEEYFTNMEADSRPTDIMGKTASEQATYVNGVRQRAGSVMNTIANGKLTKTKINITRIRSEFHLAIRGLRGKITENGLEFDPKSKISTNSGDKRVLADLQAKLNAYGGNPTGQELHEFKQWLAEQVDLNKSPLNKSEGITAGIEKILNDTRVEVNKLLRKSSEPYARANDIYSETKTALDTLQKGAGNIDMFGEGAESALGTTMNRLLGNAQSRQNVTSGLNKIQDAAIKYKGQFEKQNYVAQARFVDEMENLWGPFTETSFRAQSGDAAARLLQNPGVAQAGREAVGMAAKEIKKLSQSRAKQLQALRELLYERGD